MKQTRTYYTAPVYMNIVTNFAIVKQATDSANPLIDNYLHGLLICVVMVNKSTFLASFCHQC